MYIENEFYLSPLCEFTLSTSGEARQRNPQATHVFISNPFLFPISSSKSFHSSVHTRARNSFWGVTVHEWVMLQCWILAWSVVIGVRGRKNKGVKGQWKRRLCLKWQAGRDQNKRTSWYHIWWLPAVLKSYITLLTDEQTQLPWADQCKQSGEDNI